MDTHTHFFFLKLSSEVIQAPIDRQTKEQRITYTHRFFHCQNIVEDRQNTHTLKQACVLSASKALALSMVCFCVYHAADKQ